MSKIMVDVDEKTLGVQINETLAEENKKLEKKIVRLEDKIRRLENSLETKKCLVERARAIIDAVGSAGEFGYWGEDY